MFMTQKGSQVMLKTLSKIFPFFDHLYIYQILEYNSWDLFLWFIKNPFERDLQKKHKLKWTNKTKLLALVGLTLILVDSIFTSLYFFQSPWFILFFIFFKGAFSPLFLIVSQILIWPLENYQKQKLILKTKEKLSKLPKLKVVAITGSFGKTSTKDILYTLLFKKYYVVRTPKSFNTPLGISQTILDLIKENTNIFICEVGAYKIGEIAKIAQIIKPDIGIITAVGPQHLEKFGSLEKIAKAKFELAQNLKKNGLAILNGNYDLLINLASENKTEKIIYYGRQEDKFYATNIKTDIDGTSFTLLTPSGKAVIKIPLVGEHHTQNFLAATAAALNLGLTLTEIQKRAALLLPTPHRLEIKKVGNTTFIDNSYNINPKSAESSLKLLSSFDDTWKIIITPGFVELGKKAGEANRQFGNDMACLADEIIIVGESNKLDLLEGIGKVWPTQNTTYFANSTKEAITLAQQLAKERIKTIARDDTQVVILLEGDLPDQYL